jgi:hypothetical protein
MKKIKLNEKFHGMGTKKKTYYFSGIKQSYGYDIFDENFIFSFAFGDELKNDFINYSELNITFFEKIRLILVQYLFMLQGEYYKWIN